MMYRMETVTLTIKDNTLRITQKTIERTMLDVTLRGHLRNVALRHRTKVVGDVMQCIAALKLRCWDMMLPDNITRDRPNDLCTGDSENKNAKSGVQKR